MLGCRFIKETLQQEVLSGDVIQLEVEHNLQLVLVLVNLVMLDCWLPEREKATTGLCQQLLFRWKL